MEIILNEEIIMVSLLQEKQNEGKWADVEGVGSAVLSVFLRFLNEMLAPSWQKEFIEKLGEVLKTATKPPNHPYVNQTLHHAVSTWKTTFSWLLNRISRKAGENAEANYIFLTEEKLCLREHKKFPQDIVWMECRSLPWSPSKSINSPTQKTWKWKRSGWLRHINHLLYQSNSNKGRWKPCFRSN